MRDRAPYSLPFIRRTLALPRILPPLTKTVQMPGYTQWAFDPFFFLKKQQPLHLAPTLGLDSQTPTGVLPLDSPHLVVGLYSQSPRNPPGLDVRYLGASWPSEA